MSEEFDGLFQDGPLQDLVPKKRRKASKSPMQRTLAELRKQGAVCGIVEKFNKFANVRQDLFGCIDIVALRDNAIVGVQCTSDSHHADHIAKCKEEPRLTTWLLCGGKFEVWSWRKSKPRGVKRELWTFRVDAIQIPQSYIDLRRFNQIEERAEATLTKLQDTLDILSLT